MLLFDGMYAKTTTILTLCSKAPPRIRRWVPNYSSRHCSRIFQFFGDFQEWNEEPQSRMCIAPLSKDLNFSRLDGNLLLSPSTLQYGLARASSVILFVCLKVLFIARLKRTKQQNIRQRNCTPRARHTACYQQSLVVSCRLNSATVH